MPLPPAARLLRRPKPGSGDFSWDADEYSGGNRLTFYTEGAELFRDMAAAIEEARESVHLETYILASDRTGRAFADLLAAAARRGAAARLVYDSVGSIDLDPSMETRLRNAGVQIHEYHPVAPWRPRWAWNQRDHRKILVCDGRVAFTGGMNLCDDHAPPESGGRGWPDAHARLEGPAAYDLDRCFREVWFRHTGRWFDSAGRPEGRPGGAPVRVVSNDRLHRRFAIRQAYVNALRAARREVSIANSYFIPDWRIRRSLRLAAARGARVRVLVPGRSDNPAARHAMRAAYRSLLAGGVRLFEWQGPMLHAKAAVVDGLWCAVGSYNLDHRSLRHNLEVNVHVLDRAFAARLSERFERGVAGAVEIRAEDWRRRPWSDRLLEQVFSSFEYFL